MSRWFFVWCLLPVVLTAGEFTAQLSVLSGLNAEQPRYSPLALHIIPDYSDVLWRGEERYLDAQIAFDAVLAGDYSGLRTFESGSKINPYLLWLRLAGGQYEIRAGLQKINFGPAILLRALRWFDRIDPRDPLQLADGVYGLLGRFYFLNNANVWIWGLTGNSGRKGLEIFENTPGSSEWGGRVQVPAGDGELGVSAHTRSVAWADASPREYRVALDGRWDYGIGFWFENAVNQYSAKTINAENFVTIGADYTFGLGNGLYLVAERLHWWRSDDPLGPGAMQRFTGLSASYNFGMIDNVRLMVFFTENDQQFFRFLSWSRTYDNVVFYLNSYWNPDNARFMESANVPGGGYGFQLAVIYNY
jgi:hypothetical protein